MGHNEIINVTLIDNITSLKNHILEINSHSILTISNPKLENFLNKNNIDFTKSKEEIKEHLEKVNIHRRINQTNSNDVTIFIGKDGDIENIALYFSYATKKKFLSYHDFNDFEEKQDKNFQEYDSLTIITTVKYGFEIQSYIAQWPDFLNIGIIVGKDNEDLLYIINKSILAHYISASKAIVIDRTDKLSNEIEDICDEYTYIPYSLATKSILSKTLSEPITSLSLIGHGRDELLWITKGIICGGAAECSGEHQTSCVQNGQCFKNSVEILNISEIKALNLFVNACCSGKIGNALFGDNANIMHNFLTNFAVTYIGTPFLANGCEALNHYYTALLLSNRKIGEINKLLNMFYSNYGIGIKNSYYLLGDPTIRFENSSQKYQIIIEVADKGISEFYLEREAYLVELHVKGNLQDDFINLRREVVLKGENRCIIYCHMFYNACDNKTVLHIFSKGRLGKGRYVFRIDKRESVDINTLYNFNYFFELGLCESKLKRYYIESINSLNNYSSVCRFNMTRLDNISNAVYVKRDKIEERVKAISREIVTSMQNRIHSKGIAFDELCLGSGFRNLGRNLLEENCPYCGGKIFENIVINDIFKEKRKHIYCYKCGNILDAPEKNMVSISFTGSESFCENQKEQCVALEIKNLLKNQVDGCISIAIVNGVKEMFCYLPENEVINLQPNEKKTVFFNLNHEERVACHNYWLMGIGVFESELYLVKRDIFYNKGESE